MDNKVYYKIGNNIKSLRESFGLSQEELALEIGIGKSAICQYESVLGTHLPLHPRFPSPLPPCPICPGGQRALVALRHTSNSQWLSILI